MAPITVAPGVFWVGAVDWNIRHFHGHTYTTSRGTTYNAYLIVDEKIALVDTVYRPFAREMIDRIRRIVDPSKIDYIIANHVEPDHSGALSEVLKLCPKAKIFGSAKCKDGLYKYYYGAWDFKVVKTGDTLKLGKKTVSFIEAPMLHWPDSMFSYIVEDAVLLPNDAFGQHYASSERFDDEVDGAALMDEAAKYYGNILWPFSALVQKKIADIGAMKIPLKVIAPSHGIIWRKNPAGIVQAYAGWAKNTTKKKAVIVYETMWGSTAAMARAIAEGLIDSGVSVRIFDIASSDSTEIIKEMLEAKGYLIGSSTHDNDLLHTLAGFLVFLRGLKPKNRIGCAFGSYGWAGGAVKSIEKYLNETGVSIAQDAIAVQYMPDGDEIKKSYEFGKKFAEAIKQGE
ncbi:MAG: flavodoxin domain-containing protein [Candidatus Omnitrophota bacterium]